MDENIAAIVLDELRAFRAEVNEWRQDMTERVATLEAHDKDITGNGQPGRMTDAEKKITRHDRIIWIGYGVLLAVQAGVAALWHFWPRGAH